METELLKKLVLISSEYPNEKAIGEYIYGLLRSYPGKVYKQSVEKNRFNLLYEIGDGPAMLLLGHLDTVSGNESWAVNPHILVKKGDKLSGLGAWDMKAGLSAILSVTKNFIPNNFKLKIAFTVDEENVSIGAEKLIGSGWLKDVLGCVSLEPGFNYGEKGICLGRIGRSIFDITVKTEGGHTYLAKNGQNNAIEIAWEFISSVRKLPSVRHRKLGKSNIFVRSISSDTNGMSIPNMVNMQIEANLVSPLNTDKIFKQLQDITLKKMYSGKIKISKAYRPTPFCEPYVIDKSHVFVKKAEKLLGQVIKQKPKFYYRNSVADDNRIAKLGIPVITIGPGGGNAHQANEWVSEKSMKKITAFLNKLLMSYN